MSLYMPYLYGGFFILSSDLLEDIYATSLDITYFWIEDVFLTGIVRQALKQANLFYLSDYFTHNERQFQYQYLECEGDSPKYFYCTTESILGMWFLFLESLSKHGKHLVGGDMRYEKLWESSRYISL